jgi:hypothetical protein
LIATDNATVVTCLQNQGGTHSFSLYLLCREIMLLCDSFQTVLTMRHIPGNQNLIADALSRFRVPVNTEWELQPVIYQASTLIWGRPLIDLFATSLNYKLETFVSSIPDQKAWLVDAMTISWKGIFNNIFPTFRLPHRILHKMREDGCKTYLIAPTWSMQSWFLDLLLLSCGKRLPLPLRGDLLSQFKGRSFIKAWRIFICTHGCCQDVYTGNNKITQIRTILQRESQNSQSNKQTKSVNNRKTVKT